MHLRYFKWFAGITITCAGLMVAINYIVDPAWIYRAVEKPGFNQVKPKLSKYRIIWKASHILTAKPDILILGNSRVELGIDPSAAYRLGLIAVERSIFNAAIPAASIYSMQRFLQQAIDGGEVKELYIGIDYLQFMDDFFEGARQAYNEHEGLFVVDAAGNPQPLQPLVIFSKTLFSTEALNSSLQTLKKQHPKYQGLTSLGFNSNESMLQSILDGGTQKRYFLNEDIRFIDTSIKSTNSPAVYRKGLEELRALLLLAQKNHIKTTLFTSPAHVHLQYLDAHAGDGEDYYQWKRELAGMVADVNKTGENPVVMWDFSIPNIDTMEQLPENDVDLMQWYLDPSHYRATLGERMMRRFMGGKPAAGDEHFGMLLTADTVEENIRQHREQLLFWQQNYPQDYSDFMARIEQRINLHTLPHREL